MIAINCKTEIGMSVADVEEKPRIKLTERQRDTILAALLLWRRTAWLSELPEWIVACNDHDDDYALTKEEVMELVGELSKL